MLFNDDTLLLIFTLVIDHPEEFLRVCSVCKRWNRLARDEEIWHRMYKRTIIPLLLPSRALKVLNDPLISEEAETFQRRGPGSKREPKKLSKKQQRILSCSKLFLFTRYNTHNLEIIRGGDSKIQYVTERSMNNAIILALGPRFSWFELYPLSVSYLRKFGNRYGGSFSSPNSITLGEYHQIMAGAKRFPERKIGKVLFNQIKNIGEEKDVIYEQWIYHRENTKGSVEIVSTIHMRDRKRMYRKPFAYSVKSSIRFCDSLRQGNVDDVLEKKEGLRSLDSLTLDVIALRMSTCGISPDVGRYCIFWDSTGQDLDFSRSMNKFDKKHKTFKKKAK